MTTRWLPTVAKYVTKGATDTRAGTDHPLTARADIESAPVSEHVRTLMLTCCGAWAASLSTSPSACGLWTHTLGYPGHILTKSRAYSTTYAALRAHHVDHVDLPDVTTERQWPYVGSGHTPGAALIAPGVAEDLVTAREAARDAVSLISGGALGAG